MIIRNHKRTIEENKVSLIGDMANEFNDIYPSDEDDVEIPYDHYGDNQSDNLLL